MVVGCGDHWLFEIGRPGINRKWTGNNLLSLFKWDVLNASSSAAVTFGSVCIYAMHINYTCNYATTRGCCLSLHQRVRFNYLFVLELILILLTVEQSAALKFIIRFIALTFLCNWFSVDTHELSCLTWSTWRSFR